MQKKTSIGGQAVIEGIMMKGPKKTALAVRVPDGSIDIEYITESHLKDKNKFWGFFIVRGMVNFIESMVTGYGAMLKSAEKSGFTDIEENDEPNEKPKSEALEQGEKANGAENGERELEPEEINTEPVDAVKYPQSTEGLPKDDEKADAKADTENPEKKSGKYDKLINVLMIVASALGVVIGIFLFTYLPAVIFDLSNKVLSGSISSWKAVFEGVLKIIIFLVYVFLISQMKDIKRVFQYHGAEHKTIFCYESGAELTVENVRKQSRFHPRCGTSFMILMLFVGIMLGVILTWCFPWLRESSFRMAWVFIKILILPLICGIGYELLKLCGRHENILTKLIATPGMWMQRLTTKEPDDSMIEVAIESIKAVIPENPEEDKW